MKELISNMSDNLPFYNSSRCGLVSSVIELIKKIWAIRFVRFLFVGGLNTLFGFLVYSLLILINIHYALASLCSTIIGIIFNFFTTGRIVFRNKKSLLIFSFFVVYGVVYLINLGFLKILNFFELNMILAGAILLLPMAIISYLLNKRFVFYDRE